MELILFSKAESLGELTTPHLETAANASPNICTMQQAALKPHFGAALEHSGVGNCTGTGGRQTWV